MEMIKKMRIIGENELVGDFKISNILYCKKCDLAYLKDDNEKLGFFIKKKCKKCKKSLKQWIDLVRKRRKRSLRK